MNFTLHEDWKAILTKAWSIKFSLLAAICGLAELTVDKLAPAGIPDGLFASAAIALSMLTPAVRILAQKELASETSKKE
jgi:hypothetical protein